MVYYTKIFIADHLGVAPVWQVVPFGRIILGLPLFFFLIERGAVAYDCRNPHMGHIRGDVTTPHSNGGRHRLVNYNLAQFVAECRFDQLPPIRHISGLRESTGQAYIREIAGF